MRTFSKRIARMTREMGIVETICYAPEYLKELVRHRLDRFDDIHGIDTSPPPRRQAGCRKCA